MIVNIGLLPSALNQNSNVPVSNANTRATTPPILRRGIKARRRRDSDDFDLSDEQDDVKVIRIINIKIV